MKFHSILFPVDFSERCRAVAPFINAVVKRDQAFLTLAHFAGENMMWGGTAEAPCSPEMIVPFLIEEAQDSLERLASECFPGVQAKIVVEEGDPGSCLVDLARASDVDLIMMPTRGRGRFRAALLGSVTAKVLHDSECAVWTAAHTDMPGYCTSTDWRKIVGAVDAKPDARSLLSFAKEFASTYEADIHLVHAIPPSPETIPEKYLNRDFENYLKFSARETIMGMQKEVGTSFKLCVEAGAVSSVITAVAQADEADMVLIGRGSLAHFGGRLRTHVYAIIRDAPCPVLSV